MKISIMRGIPGAGKTTWVDQNIRSQSKHPSLRRRLICSADTYHLDALGQYRFDRLKAGDAHKQCWHAFLGGVQRSAEYHHIVVDNTNTTLWEVAPYVKVAECGPWDWEIITVWCDPIVAARRNVHEVPVETVLKSYHNLLSTELPSWWKHRIVLADNQR